ncbi:peroxiredoxin-5, mitochondrial-like isoform X2 [Pollicipes pollicipes]|nr:peroxiredoxin-5, mitochondrial-like isoform X2 [Pollicipes pollicipes]
MIKVGDKLPAATLFEGSPANSVNTADLCKGKTVILFGVPGAFTPACSQVCPLDTRGSAWHEAPHRVGRGCGDLN